MHFRILEMIATNGFLTALKCTKFVFGKGSDPEAYYLDSTGGAYSAPPDPLVGLIGLYCPQVRSVPIWHCRM